MSTTAESSIQGVLTTTEGRTFVPNTSPTCSIVLGTLNERKNLPTLIRAITQAVGEGVELVVVDDGSVDGTREYLFSIARHNSLMKILLNDEPQSLARAHAQGFLSTTAPLVVFMDADLQHPPELIPKMLEELQNGNDMVVATRYHQDGRTGPRPPIRGILSRGACFLTRLTLRNARGLTDPISGYFAMKRGTVSLDSTEVPKGYELLIYVLAKGRDLKIAEVPYSFGIRPDGESKIIRGTSFLRVFLTQLVLDKKVEFRRRNSETLPAGARGGEASAQ